MRILFIGGGTAGHIDPALAVARECKELMPSWIIEFLGGGASLEKNLIPQAGFRLNVINKVPLPRKFTLSTFSFPFRFLFATFKSIIIVSKFDAVVGFGGYVAPPAYIAAKLLHKKIFIHEANAKPGFANKLGVRFATQVWSAFPLSDRTFSKAQIVGMPLKQEIIEASKLKPEQRLAIRSEYLSSLGLSSERSVIVVMGGSSGSHKINQIIDNVKESLIENGFSIIHSVGSNGALHPTPHYYPAHYLYEMGKIYASADFVIARSGAVTTAEIELMGIPALFIPLAIGNGEQSMNAQVLVKKGLAHLIPNSEFSSERLLSEISWIKEMCDSYNGSVPSQVMREKISHQTASEKIVGSMMKELGK